MSDVFERLEPRSLATLSSRDRKGEAHGEDSGEPFDWCRSLQTLFHESEDFFLVFSKDGRILKANETVERRLGYAGEELASMSIIDLHPSEMREEASVTVASDLMAGKPIVWFLPFKARDGAVIPVETKVARSRQGNREVLVAIARDITERQRIQESLREAYEEMESRVKERTEELRKARDELELRVAERTAELHRACEDLKEGARQRLRLEEDRRRLAAAIEQAAESIVITDTDGRIEYVNPSFERITGYGREEVIGKSPRILNSGEHSAGFYENMWSTLHRGEAWSGRIANRRKNGETYQETTTISPVRDDKGNVVNFVAVKRDITDELSLEAKLRQAQKMEAIGNLAGGIAHDFNNLLTVILGFSDMALNLLPEDSGKARGCVEQVRTAGNRARELVSQILTFSRQEEGERRPYAISSIVKEALKLLRSTLPANIELRKDVSARGAVLCDPTQIHQVIMNLCTNAYHAMRETGGVLDVSLEDAVLDASTVISHPGLQPGPHLKLSVVDTGCGMDSRVIDRIFEPYFTTKTKGEGTGLGLSVVHGIVREHKGEISVYSEAGRGTSFHVHLPAVAGASTAEADGPFQEPPRGREHILLVDDEESLQRLGAHILGGLGYRVAVCGNGVEALEWLQEDSRSFDLVITDQSMPRMTGLELARRLLSLRPDLPVILCTGFAYGVTRERVREAGIRELVMKPFRSGDLAEKVRLALDRGSPRE